MDDQQQTPLQGATAEATDVNTVVDLTYGLDRDGSIGVALWGKSAAWFMAPVDETIARARVPRDLTSPETWMELIDRIHRDEFHERNPWVEEFLPLCDGLALLPTGKNKIPVDPANGSRLVGWQSHAFSVDEIRELEDPAGAVWCLSYRPGPDSGNIISLDLDGDSASAWFRALGAEPNNAGWRTTRAADRQKAHYRLTDELHHALVEARGEACLRGKIILTTKEAPPGGKAEQIELFIATGQCVIAGQPSEGPPYKNHGSPQSVTEPDEAMAAALIELVKAAQKPDPRSGGEHTPGERWQSGPDFPCPVCGRDKRGGCTIWLTDDELPRLGVNCLIGQTFRPPSEIDMPGFGGKRALEKGDVVPGADGGQWVFSRQGQNPSVGMFRTFLQDRPRSAATESKPATRSGNTHLSYKLLLKNCLLAIVEGDEDSHMQYVADLKSLFRLSDEQIQSRLLRLHMDSKVQKTDATGDGVDLDLIEQLDYALEGWIPKGAVRMTYGSAGTGKTTLCVWTAHNFVQGNNILDRDTPCEPGKALFIATDSGAGPLKKALADLGIDPKEDPLWRPGPQQRVWVWAHAPEQGHEAWLADIRGLIYLEKFIQKHGVGYVVIDSAKSTTADVFSYTSNESVKALMRYLQNCICEPLGCCVDWINHDGTEKGSAAGAKAWREDPSMVIRLTEEKDCEDRQIGVRVQFVKDRAAVIEPKRTLVYQLKEGELDLAPGVEVVGFCKEQILEVLWERCRFSRDPMSTSEIKQEVLLRFMTSGKTVENTLARLVQDRPQKVVKPRRGFYALAPAEIEKRKVQDGDTSPQAVGAPIRLSTLWGGKSSDPLQQKRSNNPPPTPHRGEPGDSNPRLARESLPPQPPTGGTPGGREIEVASRDLGQIPPVDTDIPSGCEVDAPSRPFSPGDRVEVRTVSGQWNSGWEVDGSVSPQGWVPVRFPLKPEVHTCFPQADLRLDRSTATA